MRFHNQLPDSFIWQLVSILFKSKISGYKKAVIQAVKEELLQVFYTKGEEEILIRKGSGSDDISGIYEEFDSEGNEDNSGDYNEYTQTNKIQIGSSVINIKGNDGKYDLAIWNDGTYSYSINLSTALDEKQFIKLLKKCIS